jgi:hypothetical protein
VHYKPSTDPKYAGELARLDLRDDFPQAVLQPKHAENNPPVEKKSENRE